MKYKPKPIWASRGLRERYVYLWDAEPHSIDGWDFASCLTYKDFLHMTAVQLSPKGQCKKLIFTATEVK